MADSIISELTPHSLAAEIRMQRSAGEGSVLLVEGPDDAKFYKRFTNVVVCTIFIAHGKDRASAVLAILKDEEFPGILCLLDADFSRLLGRDPEPNVVFTDTHDVETMLIRSVALEAVIDEFGGAGKIPSFESSVGMTVREFVVVQGACIGCLRLLSQKENWNLKFDDLNYDFVDRSTLEIRLDDLLNKVLARSDFNVVPRADVKAMVERELDSGYHAWEICNGHDLVAILERGFRHAIGSCSASEISQRHLASSLRLALDYEDFKGFDMFRSIRTWELNNPPYLISK